MGQPARVKSIEALDVIASALKTFRGDSMSALDDLDIELHRALKCDSPRSNGILETASRRAEDKVTEAEGSLKQRRDGSPHGRLSPGLRRRARRIERAKQRLRIAEQKVKAVQVWTHTIDRAVSACQQASGTQFVIWLDSDVPKGIASLKRMTGSLETYVALQVPVNPNAPAVLATGTSQEEPGNAETTDPSSAPSLAAQGNAGDADPPRKDSLP